MSTKYLEFGNTEALVILLEENNIDYSKFKKSPEDL